MNAIPNPANSNTDKNFLVSLLRESRENFLGSFAGVSEELSRLHPADNCWCVLETVEHLASAEGIMLRLITTQRRPRSADAANREQVFLQVVADRSRKMQSPEGGQPCGRFASLAEAAAQFKATRDSVIQFVEQQPDDLRASEVTHPHPAAGNVSTYEMVIIIAKHAERHAKQIEEIRNSISLHADAAKGK
ncbi:MAG TPA: DinB family protein, partial [Candidatus Dormibacteraeota bacterium]|nr:DinB family protein [Candidatus Dormibacteraeota bacterium]